MKAATIVVSSLTVMMGCATAPRPAPHVVDPNACQRLTPDELATSPLEWTRDIRGVRRLVRRTGFKGSHSRLIGAVVTYRDRPWITVESLQSVIDCHVTRTASASDTERARSPFALPGVTARVVRELTGVEVKIRAGDVETAEEVVARTRRLAETDPDCTCAPAPTAASSGHDD